VKQPHLSEIWVVVQFEKKKRGNDSLLMFRSEENLTKLRHYRHLLIDRFPSS